MRFLQTWQYQFYLYKIKTLSFYSFFLILFISLIKQGNAMKKQNIFIDFDGTICFDRFWRLLPLETRSKIGKFLFQDNLQLFKEWMRGKRSSEEIHHMISEECGLDYNMMWEHFVRGCQTVSVSEDILKALADCKKNNTLILITDNLDCFNRFVKEELKLSTYFHYIFNSYDYGVLKEDPAQEGLFKKIIDLNKFDLHNSVLLDNDAQNCELFNQLGGTSFLIKDKEDTVSTLNMLRKGNNISPLLGYSRINSK